MSAVGFSFADMVELEVDTYKDNGELDRTNKISHPITIINS